MGAEQRAWGECASLGLGRVCRPGPGASVLAWAWGECEGLGLGRGRAWGESRPWGEGGPQGENGPGARAGLGPELWPL